MGRTIKQVLDLKLTFGGEEASGWLPPGAAKPLSTPIQECVIDAYISEEGNGYMLNWAARDSDQWWSCSWHRTMDEAEKQALRDLGIQPSDWIEFYEAEDSL